MTGPTKAVVIIALAVIVMVSLNIAMWRRMRAGLVAAKADQAANPELFDQDGARIRVMACRWCLGPMAAEQTGPARSLRPARTRTPRPTGAVSRDDRPQHGCRS